jgi:hypothetical protein
MLTQRRDRILGCWDVESWDIGIVEYWDIGMLRVPQRPSASLHRPTQTEHIRPSIHGRAADRVWPRLHAVLGGAAASTLFPLVCPVSCKLAAAQALPPVRYCWSTLLRSGRAPNPHLNSDRDRELCKAHASRLYGLVCALVFPCCPSPRPPPLLLQKAPAPTSGPLPTACAVQAGKLELAGGNSSMKNTPRTGARFSLGRTHDPENLGKCCFGGSNVVQIHVASRWSRQQTLPRGSAPGWILLRLGTSPTANV